MDCSRCIKTFSIVFLFTLSSITTQAQSLTTLFRFDGSNGGDSTDTLIQGPDGNLYGTTSGGGAFTDGTVFKLTRDGELSTIYSFCAQSNCTDGANPYGGLLLATDGSFYGTTSFGGVNETGGGVVFRITPAGAISTLYTFCSKANCVDGAGPLGTLIEASDGNFYGTTSGGGNNGQGTVFRVTPGGNFMTLYSFCSQAMCSDGAEPSAGLVQANDGNLYGITNGGGGIGECYLTSCGTAFKITLNGVLTTLHRFCLEQGCPDGAYPGAGLVEASDGYLYGTNGNKIFRIDRLGVLTTLDTFCKQKGCPEGDAPLSALIQATDGKLYGTNSRGGSRTVGTIFNFAATGITALYTFCSQSECADGAIPYGGLVQATNGIFYGTTSHEGAVCCGTAFSFDMGLGPFIAFVRPYGKVDQTVGILGQGLTGITSVSLNGTPAIFTVVSDTFIKATVPSGATTGYVTVTTPSGTLTSNVPFRVLP